MDSGPKRFARRARVDVAGRVGVGRFRQRKGVGGVLEPQITAREGVDAPIARDRTEWAHELEEPRESAHGEIARTVGALNRIVPPHHVRIHPVELFEPPGGARRVQGHPRDEDAAEDGGGTAGAEPGGERRVRTARRTGPEALPAGQRGGLVPHADEEPVDLRPAGRSVGHGEGVIVLAVEGVECDVLRDQRRLPIQPDGEEDPRRSRLNCGTHQGGDDQHRGQRESAPPRPGGSGRPVLVPTPDRGSADHRGCARFARILTTYVIVGKFSMIKRSRWSRCEDGG